MMEYYQLMNEKTIKKVCYRFYNSINKETEYETAKEIIYGNKKAKDNEMLKNIYDAFEYFINNKENFINDKVIKRLYYLLFEKEISDILLNELIELFYNPLKEEKLVELYYVCNKNLSSKEMYIFYYVLMMYYIFTKNSKIIHFNKIDIEELINILTNFEKERFNKYLIQIMVKQDNKLHKTYYQNLKETTCIKIYDKLKELKEEINNYYKIEHLILYGSYVKNTNNINSDIDLMVKFKEGYTYLQRKEYIERFKEYVFAIFKRYADVQEMFINVENINEIKNAIKVF